MLSSRGFAVLSLAFFHYDDLPKNLENMQYEYFEEAVDFLLSQNEVMSDKCGVLALSQSVNYGLYLGIHHPKVKAVVAINGPTSFYMGSLYHRGICLEGFSMTKDEVLIDEHTSAYPRDDYLKEMLSFDSRFSIPVENAPQDTCFLYLAGTKDVWGSMYSAEALKDKTDRYGLKNFEVVEYPGAGHLIEPPYGPLCYRSKNKTAPVPMLWGGEVQSHCEAQEDAWRRVQQLFEKCIRSPLGFERDGEYFSIPHPSL